MVDDLLSRQTRIWIQKYLEEPLSDDPLTRMVQQWRAEAAHHRACHNLAYAAAKESAADELEQTLKEIRTTDVDYDTAGTLADVTNGTVRNKVSQGEWKGGNGRVVLASITIAPTRAPDTHGVIALDRVRELKAAESEERADERKAKDDMRARVQQARKKRKEA